MAVFRLSEAQHFDGYTSLVLFVHSPGMHRLWQDTALAIISIYLHVFSFKRLSVFSQHKTRHATWLCSGCLLQPKSLLAPAFLMFTWEHTQWREAAGSYIRWSQHKGVRFLILRSSLYSEKESRRKSQARRKHRSLKYSLRYTEYDIAYYWAEVHWYQLCCY